MPSQCPDCLTLVAGGVRASCKCGRLGPAHMSPCPAWTLQVHSAFQFWAATSPPSLAPRYASVMAGRAPARSALVRRCPPGAEWLQGRTALQACLLCPLGWTRWEACGQPTSDAASHLAQAVSLWTAEVPMPVKQAQACSHVFLVLPVEVEM